MLRRFSTTSHARQPSLADAPDARNILLTTALIALLAAIRFTICGIAAAEVGWELIGSVEAVIVLLSAFCLAIGVYYSVARTAVVFGMIVAFPGLFLLSAVDGFQTQYIVFYLFRQHELSDAWFATLDAALGLDWTAYCTWMFAHPTLHRVTTFAYDSIWWQPFALYLLFAWRRRLRDYLCLSLALPLSFVITCIAAAYLPALGAYQFYGMSPEQHPGLSVAFTDRATAAMLWLRQGDVSGALPAFSELRLITFPSWHAAAAAIFTTAYWPLGRIRWGGLALNAFMLLATPVQGSHYFVDVIAGLAVGALSCWIAYGLLRKPQERDGTVDIRTMAPA